MTVAGVQHRAQGLLDSGQVQLVWIGPTEVMAECIAHPRRSTRRDGGRPATFRVMWREGGGWRCECAPRQPGPCPHVLALRGLIATQDVDHAALKSDPWEPRCDPPCDSSPHRT